MLCKQCISLVTLILDALLMFIILSCVNFIPFNFVLYPPQFHPAIEISLTLTKTHRKMQRGYINQK